MRKIKFKNITIINQLISHDDIIYLRNYLDGCTFNKDDNNPNEFINVSDVRCTQILQDAQNSLKSCIEEEFRCQISNEGIGTVVRFSVGWELPYHCDQWSSLPTYSGGATRDISSIIYLSDDFSGGELEFPDIGMIVEPSAGSAIFFTGNEEYMHRVRPVISGSRMTCTGFWSILSNHDHVSIPPTAAVSV